jgi:L-malate glycosyltransferase
MPGCPVYRVVSPLATGNGAFVVHRMLEQEIPGYSVSMYNPWLTLFPPALYFVGRGLPAEIIHTTADYALFACRRNVPLVVTFQNYVLDPFMAGYSSVLQRLHYRSDLRWFTRRSVKVADAITAGSRFTAELARRDLRIKSDIQVIYNGVDEVYFSPGAEKQGGTIKVLFSGNLTRRKGAQWLVSIADRIGDGIEILYTAGLRTKRSLPENRRLRCVGNVKFEDMPKLYREVDILLLPTVREGLSLAVLEGMACGLPVVATNISSLPELIDDGNGGFLCALGDVQGFAEKIDLLAESRWLRKQMGEYNRARVEAQFTLKRMVAGYESLFSGLLGKPLPV